MAMVQTIVGKVGEDLHWKQELLQANGLRSEGGGGCSEGAASIPIRE